MRLFSMIVACLLLVGCFDAESLIEERRAIAMRDRLEEVDLGEFQVSLPQPSGTVEAAEIFFHVFGQVANRDMETVQESLENLGPEFRHRLLLAVRQLALEDIQDPPLTTLRKKITDMVNETLPGEPLQSVGFYRFGYSNL
ncbi:MAG: flagellar basal body-associated FliL family protein [Planctomycetes bacterium]|nr:flagellar basal body-associated FliL family protein [Planctomycetota bacterium]